MLMVGIRELKNRLPYYLKLATGGNRIIVTDRGTPIAVLHSLERLEKDAGIEEKLAALAKMGMVRLPLKQGELSSFKSVKAKGKPASEIIIEERR